MRFKAISILLFIILSVSALYSQSYKKKDFLLGVDAGIARISKGGSADGAWEGVPVSVSIEYMLLDKNRMTLSAGIELSYFRHQLFNKNYGVTGIGVPVCLHYHFLPKLSAFAGYRPGLYFDGYKPDNDSLNSGYSGLYSEIFAGARYFITKRFAVYTEISSGDFRVDLGVSLKL